MVAGGADGEGHSFSDGAKVDDDENDEDDDDDAIVGLWAVQQAQKRRLAMEATTPLPAPGATAPGTTTHFANGAAANGGAALKTKRPSETAIGGSAELTYLSSQV